MNRNDGEIMMTRKMNVWLPLVVAATACATSGWYVLSVTRKCESISLKDEADVTLTVLREIEREADSAGISLNERTIWSDEDPSFIASKLSHSGLPDLKYAVADAVHKNASEGFVVFDSRFRCYRFHTPTSAEYREHATSPSGQAAIIEAMDVGVSRPGFTGNGSNAVIMYNTEPVAGGKMLGVMAVTRDATKDYGWRVIDKMVLAIE